MATSLTYGNTHAKAFPSKLLAQNGGKHIYNIKLSTNTDNGNLVARGDFIDLDSYEEGAVTTFTGTVQKKAANGNYYVEVVNPGDALLIYMQPFIAEEYTNKFLDEKRWFNAANTYARGYELAKGDVFEVSAEGFTTSTITAGASITGVTGKKLVIG